jgi:DNA-binding transcriptional ArsR family regulator
MSESQTLLIWLRAAAEATRLRLLALCAERELSVSDLAEVLGQSEPRVSRHLRILTEAGLIERVRQGQWVHYRLTRATPAAGFVLGLLGQLDRADRVLAEDRQRARTPGASGTAAPAASRLGRELRAVLETEMMPQAAAVLLVGVEHPELLLSVVQRAAECTAIVQSRRSAQAIRAMLEREQLACRIVLAAGAQRLAPRDSQRLGGPFEAVVIDRLAQSGSAESALLAAARAALTAEGRLWLFERYEAGASERIVEHPIARLRRRLAEAGLDCQRIRPIEADGRHVLAASAVAMPGGLSMSRAG